MSNNSIFKNTIKADKNAKLLLEISNIVTENCENIAENTQSIIDLNYAITEINKKIESSLTITIDDELSITSENPVQNKVISNALNSYDTSLEVDSKLNNFYTKTDIDNNFYNVSEIDGKLEDVYTMSDIDSNFYTKTQVDNKISEIQIIGGNGVQYQNSVLAENIAIVDISSSSGIANNVNAVLSGKVLPIAVVPHDTSATWRNYCIRGYTYDSESDNTTISIIATDTSTNVDICYMPVLEQN